MANYNFAVVSPPSASREQEGDGMKEEKYCHRQLKKSAFSETKYCSAKI